MGGRRCEPVTPARDPARRAAAEAPLVYTVAEVAERLKVSPGTVRNMIDQGQLYALRLHVRRIVVASGPSTSSSPGRHPSST